MDAAAVDAAALRFLPRSLRGKLASYGTTAKEDSQLLASGGGSGGSSSVAESRLRCAITVRRAEKRVVGRWVRALEGTMRRLYDSLEQRPRHDEL